MSLENRPYVGTWSLNNRQVVKYTPDALVYVNGNLDIAGCPTCGGRVDIQKYITAVNVDAGVETGGASASITMVIPRQDGHSFFRDGQFILRAGLEINIYYRGYFPVKGLLSDIEPGSSGGVNVKNAVMYPYYHVFHGVVTSTTYEYSGGEHTASMSCSDILHFWNHQVFSTKAGIVGDKPGGSKSNFTIMGSSLEAKTPYGIVYTLYRQGMGAAGGVVGTVGGQATNMSAVDENSDSLFSLASLYWEKRWAENFNQLRMYGANGNLYNAWDQAFLGSISTSEGTALAKTFSDPALQEEGRSPDTTPLQETARQLGFDWNSTFLSQKSQADAEAGGFGLNILQLQAFTTDLTAINVNVFESEYETKMNLVQRVCQLTNFEFYQDVDGDFVFKPPFYNLDTSQSEVYVIQDIDIITISFTQSEPDVTVLHATAPLTGNLSVGTPSETDSKSTYVDYRLVAQFGWREDNFEAPYAGGAKAMFWAAVSRMDVFNLKMNSASCQIPMRPELRPGYPVYLEPFDCFYYLQSFTHTFSFGGQCTTDLTLQGRRSKFYAPGMPPEDGSKATVENIDLGNPWLAPLPLEVEGNDGIPRLQGFPNVVMALDPELRNPSYFKVDPDLTNITTEDGITTLILKARLLQVLETDLENLPAGTTPRQAWITGPFLIRTGRDTVKRIGSASDLLAQANSYNAAYDEIQSGALSLGNPGEGFEDLADAQEGILTIIELMERKSETQIEGQTQLANILDSLRNSKNNFFPDAPGYYRYFSSSHPYPNMQGTREVLTNAPVEEEGTSRLGGLVALEETTEVFGFDLPERGTTQTMGQVTVNNGIPIFRPNTGTSQAVPTATHQIATLSFGQLQEETVFTKPIASTVTSDTAIETGGLVESIKARFLGASEYFGPSNTIDERFGEVWAEVSDEISLFQQTYSITQENVSDVGWTFTLGSSIQDALEQANIKGDKSPYRNVPVDADKTIGEQFQNSKAAEERLASDLAILLGFTAEFSMKAGSLLLEELYGLSGFPKTEDPEENFRAWANWTIVLATFAAELAGPNATVVSTVEPRGLATKVTTNTTAERQTVYPVFPVSDGAGYEVIGALAYGRGLSIEEGGSFQQMEDADQFSYLSIEAIEAFVNELRNQGSPSKALGILANQQPELAAEIATTADSAQGFSEGFALARTLGRDGREADPRAFDVGFSAFIASTRDRTQKLTTTNAAYGLADMGLTSTREVCSCKGAEADVLLQAYNSEAEFLSVDQPDEISKWLADRYLEAYQPWKQVQDALRGRTLDVSSSSAAEAFKAATQSYRGPNNIFSQVGSDIQEAVTGQETRDALAAAQEEIETSAADIGDLSDDIDAIQEFFNPNPDGEG